MPVFHQSGEEERAGLQGSLATPHGIAMGTGRAPSSHRSNPVSPCCGTGGQGEAECHISTKPKPTALSPGRSSTRNHPLW